MPWFLYRQNNSGGLFERTENIRNLVFIEAVDGESANLYAESIGIYFNGCKSGRDCSCCGDRWYPVWDDSDGITIEQVRGYIESYAKFNSKGFADYISAILHYADGRKKDILFTPTTLDNL